MVGPEVSTAPLVSVIVPVHNQEQFLGRCLRSLVAQDFPRDKYEIVVVDDGSSDGTCHVLDLFHEEIRTLRNEVNAGLPGNTLVSTNIIRDTPIKAGKRYAIRLLI